MVPANSSIEPIDRFESFLYEIRKEANRLSEMVGLDPDEAYARALVSVLRLRCERATLTPFETRLLAELSRIERANGGRPVSTTQLAVALGNMNRFTLHYHLSNLEARDLVARPRGPRSGWVCSPTL